MVLLVVLLLYTRFHSPKIEKNSKKGYKMGLNTFEILQEIRALEDLLNEVNPESGEFINNEDVIKDYIITYKLQKKISLII